ncbi:endonuclease/exonuclease/phosphatase family protein [Akkermansiaceae bacterium]|nr:endonuclease/exonuclease/phosphatase family protein [Akkermansiaceae bacterium]MDB4435926.1 endonuclease/exonuclease/phosphatase family protein [Akkermansiaceae bacterium]MDB4500572.1 endonuclease/exonuclease/phosphatase family protein [Akkermansiaceae bacterium]MDB4541363.1 endonuclease/exonuclease/phosphatase family protein [Akkermansiaceae bacterium]
MIYRRPWHPVSLALLGLSMALHFFTIILYVRLPDSFAAYTVFPIWVWGLIGILISAFSFVIYRGRLSLLVSLIWVFTILIMADEASSVGRIATPRITAGKAKPHAGGRVLRVATLNCARRADPTELAETYQPDILFLQEIPHTYRLKKIIDNVFSGEGDYRYNARKGCAVVVRGKIEFEVPVPSYRSQILTVKMNSGESVQLMNSHLQGATTNLRLWERTCWHQHKQNRKSRQIELAYTMGVLRQKSPYHRLPTVVAGDFNAPANDAVYRLLGNNFTDAFGSVGTGWGNTYHRALPLLRIDHIFSSKMLVPLGCKTVKLKSSDHRAVVADYVFR